MTDSRNCDDLDLLALADGLLDTEPARRAEVEAAIARSPAAAARLSDYRAQTAAMRVAFDARAAEPVPDRLHAALDRQQGARPLALASAAAVVVLSAGLGGWLIGQDGEDDVRQALIDESYRQFVTRATGDTVAASTASSGSQTPYSWIDDDVSIRIRTPDLSSDGFALVDKRALRDGGNQVVRLDYAATDGRAFSLFIAPRWANRPAPITEVERGDVSLAYWHDGPLASSIATRLPQDDARRVAEAVRRAMRDETTAPPAMLQPEFRQIEDAGNGVIADTVEAPFEGNRPAGATEAVATPHDGG